MELELFSKIIKELILEHDRVSLPGMGSYIAEMAPSVFSDRARVIHPPFRRILFRTSEIWNDGLLEDAYANEKGISKEEATKEIAQLVEMMQVKLNSDKSFLIPSFGTMRATEQNDYFFVADKELFTYLEGFGLVPVNIKVLTRKGKIEDLTGKPQPVNFDLGKFAEKIENQDDSFTVESIEEKIDKPKEELKVEERAEVIEIVEEVAEKKVVVEEVQEKREEVKKVVEKAEVVEVAKPVQVATQPQKGSTFIKKLVITLSVIFIILVVVVLLYVFKDDLKPLWETILYTKEEREILRNAPR